MRVAVIAPHDVDLVQSCGGYVSRLDREGHEVFGVNVKRHDHDAVVAAAKACGYTNLELAQVSDEAPLPTRDHISQWLATQIGTIQPDIVISPWLHDESSDHRLLAELVGMICVPWDLGSTVRRVLMYLHREGTLGFLPSVRVRVREQDARRKRMAYEMFPVSRFANHPEAWRSIEARMEGAGCRVGVDYAEEFMLMWEKV